MEVTMNMAIAPGGARLAGLTAERISGTPRVQAADSRISPARNTGSEQTPGQGIQDVVRNLEQISLSFNRRLQFVVDHRSNEITVKVIDKTTDKVIKVLPPEELQRLHSKIEETIGFLFDETV
jgi:flagellar protein FlaG